MTLSAITPFSLGRKRDFIIISPLSLLHVGTGSQERPNGGGNEREEVHFRKPNCHCGSGGSMNRLLHTEK